jgi:hypothetical protein
MRTDDFRRQKLYVFLHNKNLLKKRSANKDKTTVFAFQRIPGCFICSGRAFAPQGNTLTYSLSSADNVPFGSTLRAKGYSNYYYNAQEKK